MGLAQRMTRFVVCGSFLALAAIVSGTIAMAMSPGIPIPRYDLSPRTVLARISTPPPGVFVPLTDDIANTQQSTPAVAPSAAPSAAPVTPASPSARPDDRMEPTDAESMTLGYESVQLLGITPSGPLRRTVPTQMVSYRPPKITVTGEPTSSQRTNVLSAADLYPKSALGNLTVNFTGTSDPSGYGAWWQKDRIDVYTGYTKHIFAHEMAHQIIEGTHIEWGKTLISLVKAAPSDIPNLQYAKKVAAKGNYYELAAEVLSAYAEGIWTPRSERLRAHMDRLLDEKD